MDLRERPRNNSSDLVRHPWERARAAFFVDVLTDHRVQAPHVLDVGAGDGWLAERVRQALDPVTVTLVDAGYTDDDVTALTARGFRALRKLGPSSGQTAPTDAFDLVLLLDVVEHVDAPHALLAEVVARMRPGAHMLFSVPAIPALWSAHDVALHHHRRYRGRDARDLLENAGLALLESGGVFHSLTLPRLAQVLRERIAIGARRRGGDRAVEGVGTWRAGETVARVVTRALRGEQHLARALSRRGVDVAGLSWWALARRIG